MVVKESHPFNVKSDDYYAVLGLTKGASGDLDVALRKAYKKASMLYHPDRAERNGLTKEEAEEGFKAVSEAYNVLSDADKRKQYDLFGKVQPGQAPPPGGGPCPFGDGMHGSGMPGGSFYFSPCAQGGQGFSRSEADEIFRRFFGSRPGEPRGAVPFAFPGGSSSDSDDDGSLFGGECFTGGMGGDHGGIGGLAALFSGMDGGKDWGFGSGIRRRANGSQRRPQPSQWRSHTPPGFSRKACGQIPDGANVRIKRVKTKSEVNEQMARVLQYDCAKDRYVVQIDGGDVVMSLRADNLFMLVDAAKLVDVKSKPHLNGCTGQVTDWKDGRYLVALHSGTRLRLRPENVLLPKGTPVTINGLESVTGQRWNGKRGQIVSFDSHSGRYRVMMNHQSQDIYISVRPGSLCV